MLCAGLGLGLQAVQDQAAQTQVGKLNCRMPMCWINCVVLSHSQRKRKQQRNQRRSKHKRMDKKVTDRKDRRDKPQQEQLSVKGRKEDGAFSDWSEGAVLHKE